MAKEAVSFSLSRGTGGGTGRCARCSPLGPRDSDTTTTTSTRLTCADVSLQLMRGKTVIDQSNARRSSLRMARTIVPDALMLVHWRERPRDLTASASMPAATAQVAHATLACHRLRCAVRRTACQNRPIPTAFRRQTGAVSDAPSTLVSDSHPHTADAARGTATKRGGWRSWGTLSG